MVYSVEYLKLNTHAVSTWLGICTYSYLFLYQDIYPKSLRSWFSTIKFSFSTVTPTASQNVLKDILSISDVRRQALFFGPLHEPLVFGLRFKNSDHVITFLWLCGLQNTDHVMPFWFFPRTGYLMFLPSLSKSRGRKDVFFSTI